MARGIALGPTRLALRLAFALPGLLLALSCIPAGILAAGTRSEPTICLRDKGEAVKALQQKLKALGFDVGPVDGWFGKATEGAVKRFQGAFGLTVDGIAGPKTWAKLEQELSASRGKREAGPGQARGGAASEVELIPWSHADRLFAGVARVIDLKTGLSFKVRRRGGHYHADSEPLSSQDTAIMRRIYGGSWSWDRRAIILEVGSRRIAASMNGMPHGNDEIQDNDFEGHFCIHFLGSRIHGSGRVDPDHQSMVRLAAESSGGR